MTSLTWLNGEHFINFPAIKPEKIEPALDEILKHNREQLQLLLKNHKYNWRDFALPLAEMEDELNRFWSPVAHLKAVMNNDELRASYNRCLPKLTEYSTEMGQNEKLFAAFDSIERVGLNQAQIKSIENSLRDFRLSGVDLPPAKKQRFKEINNQLATLQTKFSENVLDCSNAWHKDISDEALLQGLPASILRVAQENARTQDKSGFVLKLDFPTWYAVMQYAHDRDLRFLMYQAYVSRAAGGGVHDAKFDNSQIMLDILKLRAEKAELLGFATYAELSLVKKMAGKPPEIFDFLRDLSQKSKQQAQREHAELLKFAAADGLDKLEAWDMAFYAEKLKHQRFGFSSEEFKPWFPLTKVLSGMFELVETLFDLTIKEHPGVPLWHEDVKFYAIKRKSGETLAYFYLDIFARDDKRGGAWMDECQVRMKKADGSIQLPIAYLNCNFTPQLKDQPALLTHDEVTTLFHEFGHGLHHMLTDIEVADVAGINGVEWDAVELPSQFMENFCWRSEVMPLISAHYIDQQPLPAEKLDALLAARNFQSALSLARQLEFALFDMRLHNRQPADKAAFIHELLEEVRSEVAVLFPPDWNYFENSFSHIFAGGYAAGYYSYKWAEVLSADAFSLFEQNGVLDVATGQRFFDCILSQGGSRAALDLFVDFRGRKPQADAMLRLDGIK